MPEYAPEQTASLSEPEGRLRLFAELLPIEGKDGDKNRAARTLVNWMAAAPITLDILNAVQKEFQDELEGEVTQEQRHKILQSGIFVPVDRPGEGRYFDFPDGVRDLLLQSIPISISYRVLGVATDVLINQYPQDEENFRNLAKGNFDAVTINEHTIALARAAYGVWRGNWHMPDISRNATEVLQPKIAAYDAAQTQK